MSTSKSSPPPSPRVALRRRKERGTYDRETLYRILDEGMLCHLGLTFQGHPLVLPMVYGRLGDRLILHGAVAGRLLEALASGLEVCLNVTHLDGLVLARSTFHHSVNYRSVVAFATPRLLTSAEEKEAALTALVEHLVPGRSRDARGPSPQELEATAVLELALDEASVKIRVGPPGDAQADLALPVWAGEIPLTLVPGAAVPAPDLSPEVDVPAYVARYRRPTATAPGTPADEGG